MADNLPTLAAAPIPKRRGRPPGSGNKRAGDLVKWIEATFAGQTPAMQAAQVAMVTPAEVKRARADARELGIVDLSLSPAVLAMAVKAFKLAKALDCDRRDAWLLMQREREGLMPYVHQKLPPKAEPKDAGQLPLVIMMADGPDMGASIDFAEADPDAIEFVDVSPTP